MSINGSGRIVDPVSIRDVQLVLGTSTNDLARLCKHAKVNMWAKYKPVPKAMIDTTGQLKSDNTWKAINGSGGLGTDAWFRGTNLDYGIEPKFYTYSTGIDDMYNALKSLAGVIDGGMNAWKYPGPGNSDPYRLLDFNRYYHGAPQPVKSVTGMPIVTASSSSHWEYSIQMMGSAINDVVGSIDERDYLIASDIIGTCYIGIAIYRKQTGNLGEFYEPIAWATGNSWRGVGMLPRDSDEDYHRGTISVSVKLVNGKTYYALPVFFAEDLAQTTDGYSVQPANTGTPTKKIWTVPYATFTEFTMSMASTSQQWGIPTTSSHQIGQVGYVAYLSLDRTSDSTYYSNTYPPTVVVQYAMVNELWNETTVQANWPSGSYAGFNSETLTITTTNRDIPLNVQNGEQKLYRPTLPSGHTWRLVFIIDGEITIINLRQYEAPET